LSLFEYKAVDAGGKAFKGVIEASDRKAAIGLLSQKGQFAMELSVTHSEGRETTEKSNAGPTRRIRVSSRETLDISTQLTTALKAGLSVLDALQIIREQQSRPGAISLLDDLIGQVNAGKPLSDAMASLPKIFGPLYVSMVRVGETGGILEQTMDQLVKLLSREEKIKSNIKNAAAYPLVVMSVGLVSAVVMLTWVLPKIIATIGADPATLPAPTRILLGISSFLSHYGWLAAIVLIAAIYAFMKWKDTPQGRLAWDTFKLKIPMVGKVLRTLAVGRFARTLGSLSKSGITILEGLAVVRDTLGNEALGAKIDEVCTEVKGGRPVAEPLGRSGLFDKLLVQIVAIGEQTGRLDELLLQAADTFDEQADDVLVRFASILPTLLILLLALVIGFIIAATLLPIMGMDMTTAF
jgi:type II secretory pathway component PulF